MVVWPYRVVMSWLRPDFLQNKGGDKGGSGWLGGKKLFVNAFIAQMSTGEGKSIVIAMLATFMCKLHKMKVHVLENNEGLLMRDYATNKPFYDRFGLSSGTDLNDSSLDICYCLKAGINRLFLKKMTEGRLDEVDPDSMRWIPI